MDLSSVQLAKRLNVSAATIRNWTDEYADILSAVTQERLKGARRRYTERDALVLATVAELRDAGLTHDQIMSALQQGRLVEELPPAPTPEEEEARRAVALVSVSELHRALDQLRTLQTEIERLIEERDRALETRDAEAKDYNSEIARLREQLGRARGIVIGSIAVVVLLLVGVITLAMLYLPRP
jgi:DNA-binding transcriptional MerR regulator